MAVVVQNNGVHQHPLHEVDPYTTYPEYEGRWQCDNCGNEQPRTQTPYHCSPCSFDICKPCYEPKMHIRHRHPLQYTNMATIYPQYQGECGLITLGTSYLSHPDNLIQKAIRRSKNLRIHPKLRSRGISGNFVFRSGQKLW